MLSFRYKDYIPQSFECFKKGYTSKTFYNDLFAGVSVGLISVPLVLAYAIGSGVIPERGLFTAIIAGFLIALLSGSRVQIAGPTGAFIVIVYGIVQRHGYDGLVIATLIAGMLMVLMGLARFGVLLKFIPYPVTTGFTTGIAVVIFSTQIKDFLGLELDKLPPQFLAKCTLYCQFIQTWNPLALALSSSVLISLIAMKKYLPKWPGAIIAIGAITAIVQFFNLDVETIQSKFGDLPSSLPLPSLPSVSWGRIQSLFPDAISIALLGAIESLLSAVIADGLTGHKHRSNGELVAQGLGNIASVVFGGICATGAIARTSANVRLGATTPASGMIHAITVLILMTFFAPYAAMIPLCAIAAILVYIAWNMSELHHFYDILKGSKSDSVVLITTFLLTVLIDLTVALQVGVLLAAMLFLKRMTDSTTGEICKILLKDNAHEAPKANDSDLLLRTDIPEEITVFEIKGPFFYSVADLLDDALNKIDPKPRTFILKMNDVPVVDMTGIQAIKHFAQRCKKNEIQFLIAGVQPDILKLFGKTGVEAVVGAENICANIDRALELVKTI